MVNTIKKDAAIKNWLEALRSGQYQQGITYLCSSDNKYCCLGVACQKLIGDPDKEDQSFFSYKKWDNDSNFLPRRLQHLLNINESGDFTNEGYFVKEILGDQICEEHNIIDISDASLVWLNDLSVPFHKIADIIEYCYKNDLFVKNTEEE